MTRPTPQTLELVRFRPKAGVDRAALLRAAGGVDRFLDGCDGFVRRELAEPSEEGGEWVDLVWWTSLDAAHRAGASVMASEDCAEFMALLDEATVKMDHVSSHPRTGGAA